MVDVRERCRNPHRSDLKRREPSHRSGTGSSGCLIRPAIRALKVAGGGAEKRRTLKPAAERADGKGGFDFQTWRSE